MQGITIVGPGRLGGALALALSDAGYRIDAIVYRSHKGIRSLASLITPSPQLLAVSRIEKINSPIVIIAAQDEDLPNAIANLRSKLIPNSIVFHSSGSLSSVILDP